MEKVDWNPLDLDSTLEAIHTVRKAMESGGRCVLLTDGDTLPLTEEDELRVAYSLLCSIKEALENERVP